MVASSLSLLAATRATAISGDIAQAFCNVLAEKRSLASLMARRSDMALKAAFFDAVRFTLSDGTLSQHRDDVFDAISAAWDKYGYDFGYAELRLAYVLATAWHETGRFKWLMEIWGPTAAHLGYEGRTDLGNTVAGDGKRFMGRGLVHITGRRNYADWSPRLGIDLLKKPEHAEETQIAARILVEGTLRMSRVVDTLHALTENGFRLYAHCGNLDRRHSSQLDLQALTDRLGQTSWP